MYDFVKTSRAIAIVTALAAITLIPWTTPAFAIKGDYTRFNVCKQLKANGNLRWHGIATGTEEDVFAEYASSRSFHTRACFTTQKACKTWVKRIWWEIPTMDELHNAWCQRT